MVGPADNVAPEANPVVAPSHVEVTTEETTEAEEIPMDMEEKYQDVLQSIKDRTDFPLPVIPATSE